MTVPYGDVGEDDVSSIALDTVKPRPKTVGIVNLFETNPVTLFRQVMSLRFLLAPLCSDSTRLVVVIPKSIPQREPTFNGMACWVPSGAI
ncbi:MAG: hypothetical protein KBF98_10005 [Rhodoferax sp.]|jgi:hypothetical protein|nr:hypothetical protein [Rhodoferax sp.]MBP9060632.1 hypothetical protein [Rhodoferax sp.]MBP9685615.1 hypothetical protein [Rhodoferax sp.]